MERKKWLVYPLLIGITLLVLWPRFGQVIQHPDAYLFTSQGDGLKNYFVWAYYLRYDEGLAFSGLNYPYGDNLLFTDSHPFLARSLKVIDELVYPISSHPIALLNLVLIAGMFVSVIVLFLLLRELNLAVWYAILAALAIFLLSPQMDRINGHLSLFHIFPIPLILWLLLRAQKSEQAGGPYLILGAAVFLVGGIHIYFTAICCSFLMAYLLCKWIRSKWARSFWSSNWMLLSCATVPLITFLLLSALVDPFSDRPQSPYGFYVYHANLASVFMPYHSAITDFLNQVFKPRMNWEGRAFIGSVPLIFFVLWSIHSLRLWWKNKQLPKDVKEASQALETPADATFDPTISARLSIMLHASLLVLLFSMCVPFEWGLQFLVDWVPPLKQFRALGRFSWVFYYVVGVSAAYYVRFACRSLSIHLPPLFGWGLLGIVLLLWLAEGGSHFLQHTRSDWSLNKALSHNNDKHLKRFELANVDPMDFQAIMALPLVSVRTDKMVFNRSLDGYQEAISCAFHTGLPIIQSSTSRPSLSQSFSNIQLISNQRIQKTRLKDMDERPLLLIVPKHTELSDNERALANQGQWFWENTNVQFYKLPLSAFEQKMDTMNLGDYQLIEHENGLAWIRPKVIFHYNGFEGNVSENVFAGSGSYYIKKGPGSIFSGAWPGDQDTMELSFWLYIDPSYDGMPVVNYRFGLDAASANSMRLDVRSIPDIVDGWLRVSLILEPTVWHEVEMLGHHMTIDELLIRPLHEKIRIKLDEGETSINNFPISKKK